jgi:hypothetical protein
LACVSNHEEIVPSEWRHSLETRSKTVAPQDEGALLASTDLFKTKMLYTGCRPSAFALSIQTGNSR